MIKLRLWKYRQDTPGPVDLRFTSDPGIILELLRPVDPTPGPVTLQFGRYEPPEYPTITGTLSASLPDTTLPDLTLTASGGAYDPPVLGTLLADLPEPTLPALTLVAVGETLSGTLQASLPAPTLPSMTLEVDAQYIIDLPDADGTAARLPARELRPSATGLSIEQQQMQPAQISASIEQAEALPLDKGLALRQQQSEKLMSAQSVPHQHGLKLDSGLEMQHDDSVRVRQAFTTAHQHGIKLGKSSAQPYAETVKLRNIKRLAEQQGQKVAGTITIRSEQGAKLQLRLTIPHTEAIYPPPGLATWPPIPPDPVDPDADKIILRFCREQDGTNTLIFGCPEKPDPGATIIIPVREAYHVINTLTLTEIDGTPVAAEDFSASIDADSWTWSWSTRIPASALAQVRPDSSTRVELIATINGEPLRVLVENIQRERRFGESWLRVSGRGRAAFLADPLAPVVQYTNDTPLTAQQALLDAMKINGVSIGWTLDWQIEDWQIPAGIWSHSGTWIDAAKRIAEAGGAYVQSHDTDQVLRILPRYPLAPWSWGTATPDIQIPEDVAEVEGIEWQEKPDYNAVWVHGGDQGRADRIIIGSTGGTNPAPTIVDELATDPAMTRQRGLALLGDTGKQASISLRLPVLPETGMIRPGTLVEYLEQGNARRGLVRSLSISHSRPELWQTIGVETHE
ncbi:hypothetical protein [Marinobacter sp.]|uniref:hypothetical protein n=1 Tax=Marinobacter sp. TaxID=50741 RepID=UPI003A94FC87